MVSIVAKMTSSAGSGFEAIIEFVNGSVSNKIVEVTNKALDKHGNDREWIGVLDGQNNRQISKRSELVTVRRRVHIEFNQSVIDLAIAELKTIMRRNLNRNANSDGENSWVNVKGIQASVSLFIARAGSRDARAINGTAEIKDFKEGDVVLLVPNYGTQMFANAKKMGGRGFMAKTANAIRRKLKINKKHSAISVRAERSRAAFQHLLHQPAPMRPATKTKGPTPIKLTLPWQGSDSAWVIAIRVRGTRGKI